MDLNKNQLMQYINAAITLETDVATQESLISIYNQNSLTRKPQLTLQKEPIQPSRPVEVEYHGDFSKNSSDGASYAFAFSFFFYVIGFILLVAAPHVWYIGFLFMLPGIPLMLPHFLKKKAASNSNTVSQDRYQKALAQYKQSLESVRKSNASATSVYNSNLSVWQKNTDENLSILRQKLSKTKSLLDQLYSKDLSMENIGIFRP